MWKDLKYLLAYISPAAAFAGIYFGGVWSFGALYMGFLVIPLVEFFVPASPDNIPEEEELSRSKQRFFDILLYLNLPIVYGLAMFYAYRVGFTGLSSFEVIAMTLNVGVVMGTCGINVAHELGHRANAFDQWVSRLLLVPEFYTHFTIEHNYGHHKQVGTPEDPATAPKGLGLYGFWVRSVTGSLLSAWRLERARLHATGDSFPWVRNNLLTGLLITIVFYAAVWWVAGPAAALGLMAAGVVGLLLLESVNYIEHYGLTREKLPSGRYEPVQPKHSWNSNHEVGRIFLYELTRHADHHYKTTRKYQILRHLENSPQLPYGYPASIILALVPPLWKSVMDKLIED